MSTGPTTFDNPKAGRERRLTADEHHLPRTYSVSHRTTYTYEEYVTDSYGRALLSPRATDSQEIISNEVEVTPEPHLLEEHTDHFGNHSHYIEIRSPHSRLVVAKKSLVRVEWPRVDEDALNQWTVESAVAALADPRADIDPVERAQYLLPSQLVEFGSIVREYAETILPPERPLGEALVALFHEIYTGFAYKKGATSVKTTLPELLEKRAGVCQDYAHLAIGCLRSVGLPARYVSGYIETAPPPGKPKLAGSDATHAWTSVMVPGGAPGQDGPGWVDLDPTNDHFADSRYIVTGWGRDYRDVTPLKGIIFSEGSGSKLDVAVDVIRQPD
ncbi:MULTISPECIES: transglutaminase family protein [unclassified Janibacter]|uniref:transglutaminase family protein n=1 Tax=unclassified Janibacter TaxID=2649294 RepID=UPI003CFDD852